MQTRSITGRSTAESNPATQTTPAPFLSASISSSGDLVEKKDAGNNYTCMKYDALHRLIQITYPAGTYATPTTPTKCFIYGTVTVNGNSMLNDNLSPGETYTTNATSCTGSGKIVDEGFSYTARGEIADVWQQTPNSAGWHHVNATYWAHGRINVLNGGTSPLPGLPAITYGASDGSGMDPKGRITKVTAGTGQNPVTAVNWNIGDHVTGVTFGSADADSYQYDANTGRMTQYQLGMGSLSQTGVLTWNSNGTLSKLAITDQINSANTHTCKYGDPSASVAGYDDLGRIISANCGSAWSQTFSFDPFGNLSKTGSSQFLPTYTSGANGGPTNQYYQISGGASGTTNYYDSNGNLKNDITHTYTWDADGNMLSVDSSTVSMIYDAFDRMIEQTRGSSHTQIVYGPYGMKLALMNGQSLVNAFVKLPGGARAVYNNSGLAYYRHSDHLGSSRLATTTSRTKQYDVAYAPYGEDYNGSGTVDLAFTDENQDTVGGGWTTNLYDFMLREYRTGHGRWTSPDPAGLGAVDPTNPQTWNRYAYVLNNPMSFVDLLGDDTCYANNGTPYQCTKNGTPIQPGETISVTASPDPPAEFDASNPGGGPLIEVPGAPPTPGASGVGGAANNRTALRNYAVTPQQQQCINNAYKNPLGKTVEWLSPLQMIPGFGEHPLASAGETAVGVTSKAAVVTQAAAHAGQPEVTTIFSEATSFAGPIERGVGFIARGTLKYAPLLWLGASVADLGIHQVCAPTDPYPNGQFAGF